VFAYLIIIIIIIIITIIIKLIFNGMIATSEPIYIALTGIVPPLIKCGNVSN